MTTNLFISSLIVGSSPPVEVVDNLLVHNTHRYNKFPQPVSFSDGELMTSFASSTTHEENGWLMVGKSRDGGATWTFTRPIFSGVQPTTVCTNLEIFDDVVYLCLQDDELYYQFKAYKSVDRGQTWIYLGQHIWSEVADPSVPLSDPSRALCQFGTGKPFKMPSGDIYIPYYAFPNTSSNNCTNGLVKITNSGLSQGPIIDVSTGTAFPNNRKHEIYVVITEVGASDATTKLVALIRNYCNPGGGECHAYWTHVRSTGLTTWTKDTVNFAGYTFGDLGNIPIRPILYNGTAYLFVSSRGFSGGNLICKIGYVTVSPADLYNNVTANYSAPTWVYTDTLAETYGSEVDFGYVEADVQKNFNILYVQWYGASPDSPSNSSGFRWLAIKQKFISDGT